MKSSFFYGKESLSQVRIILRIRDELEQYKFQSLPSQVLQGPALRAQFIFDLMDFEKGIFNCENVDKNICRNLFVQI